MLRQVLYVWFDFITFVLQFSLFSAVIFVEDA